MGQQPIVDQHSAPADKIALFRALFRGREDVYPRRFESRKTGRSGYSPACANEWAKDLCNKRKVQCAECPNRSFLPVTDEAVRYHLSGQDTAGREFVMGVYPMLLDETCFFLAADFDKQHWREDAAAVLENCRQLSLPAAVERSRSGRGGHLWLFFREAVPACLARSLGAHILTETMERRPDIGLDSYDRLFPNQDTLPKGGFGNLIALPLQKRPRDCGNSIFLDEKGVPYPDQWAFLSSVRKINRPDIERIVRAAEKRDRVVGVCFALDAEDDEAPWTMPPSRRRRPPPISGPLPKRLELTLGNEIYIAKNDISPVLRNRLLRLAAFQNPEFYKAQAMRLPTWGKSRVIACAEEAPRRHSCIGGWKRCLPHRASSVSMPTCRSLLTDAGEWRWICSLRRNVLRSSLTAHNISPMPSPTAATGARIPCCRKTAILCCGFWPRMSAGILTRSSTPSCAHWGIRQRKQTARVELPHLWHRVQLFSISWVNSGKIGNNCDDGIGWI